MKKKILWSLVLVLSLMLTGCKANYPVAQQSGKEDIAFLLFVSQKQYVDKNVSVTVDNKTFDAKTVSAKKSNRRGYAYSVATGRRKLKVVGPNGNTLYSKEIMLSAQETKQIILP